MNRNSANRVILVGHLGNVPEVRYTPSEIMTATFNLATNFSWKNDKGEYQDRTDWHKIVTWRNLAEYSKKLEKGQMIYLEGHLQTREWKDKDDNKHWMTEVIAESITKLGGKKKKAEPESEKSEEEVPF